MKLMVVARTDSTAGQAAVSIRKNDSFELTV